MPKPLVMGESAEALANRVCIQGEHITLTRRRVAAAIQSVMDKGGEPSDELVTDLHNSAVEQCIAQAAAVCLTDSRKYVREGVAKVLDDALHDLLLGDG